MDGAGSQDTSDKPGGGDAEKLCEAFGVREGAAVAAILERPQLGRGEFLFAVHRHAALVEALGLSEYAVGAGFSYVSAGDAPNGVDEVELIST